MKTRSIWIALLSTLICSTTARADLLVGDFTGTNSTVAHAVLRFSDTANGNVAPIGSFSTDVGGVSMIAPSQITYEPNEKVVYISDFFAQQILVYSQNANGNALPTRMFTSPNLGQPRQIALSFTNDELYVIAGSCCVTTYPRTSTGSVNPTRSILWGGSNGSLTQLINPTGLTLRTANDTLLVGDSHQNPDNSYSGILLSFDRTASGNVAPVATIAGSQTQLATAALSLAYDEANDELIVLSYDSSTSTDRIVTFAASAQGNVTPLRTIAGSATMLSAATTISYDAGSQTIYVSVGGFINVAPAVLAFSRASNGNVAPSRVIMGSNTNIGYPLGIAVTPDDIFKNGFE